eukprot:TRINITY_DN5977_c0_g1_i1.p1 TRINITY_DN5977_c0_g1~~TRINITY_DN5977_c0_g1_i1.p1  ORF type:complete len:961 (-),score=254.34 TRINITY_DN5977_c0_g1_i1:6-2888(-)
MQRRESSFTIIRQNKHSLELITKQTEAQEWIQSVLNERFPAPDFAASLEDGVFLCRLATVVRPGCIKKINPPSKLRFKMMENVQTFVAGCKAIGMKEQLLFDPPDLCDRQNMMKVVTCIHTLADMAEKAGFQPVMVRLAPANYTFGAQKPSTPPHPPTPSSPSPTPSLPHQAPPPQLEEQSPKEVELSQEDLQPQEKQKETDTHKDHHNHIQDTVKDKEILKEIEVNKEKEKVREKEIEIDRQDQDEGDVQDKVKQEAILPEKKVEKAPLERERSKTQTPILRSVSIGKSRGGVPLQASLTFSQKKDSQPHHPPTSPSSHSSATPAATTTSVTSSQASSVSAVKRDEEDTKREGEKVPEKKEEKSTKKEKRSSLRLFKSFLGSKSATELPEVDKEKSPGASPTTSPRGSTVTSPVSPRGSTSPVSPRLFRAASPTNLSPGPLRPASPSLPPAPSYRALSQRGSTDSTDEEESKIRSWKKVHQSYEKRNSISETSDGPPSPPSHRSSVESGSDSEGEDSTSPRRRWNSRQRSGQLKDIEKFYADLRAEAEKINNEEVIMEKIRQNEQELKDQFNQRVAYRDMGDNTSPEELEEELRERNRIEVINEILISERYYVRDLEIIINNFLKPLKGQVTTIDQIASAFVTPNKTVTILTPEEIAALFSNIDIILSVNKVLLSNLAQDFEAAGGIQLMNIGGVFLHLVEFLKIYSIYSNDQSNAIALYNRLKKDNKLFANFLAETEHKPECKNVNLLGFLIKPVQRICKYPLLFKELLKSTSHNHVDYQNIENCMKKLSQVAEYVNEMKRNSESMAKMSEIAENLVDAKGLVVVQPARVFIREGSFMKINAHGKSQERHVFLFNDILIYAKAQFFKRTNYQYKGLIRMEYCLANDVADNEVAQNQIEIVKLDEPKKKFVLCASSTQEKTAWLKDLTRIVEASLAKERNRTSRVMSQSLSPPVSPTKE